MTDRELLEKAAKAAGMVVVCSQAELHGCTDRSTIYRGLMLKGVRDAWDPLIDDGDALRLAVKLRLYVRCTANTARVRSQDMPDGVMEPTGSDPYAAARRAIVRAAAAIADQEGKV